MKYTQLGKSDLKVSKICLGCMGFGKAAQGMHSWTLPEDQSRDIIRYALDQGINFFDTAMAYQGGTSEEFLGRAIKDFAQREDVVIATKFSPRTQEEINQGIDGVQHVKNCLEASLKRLQMDYVDLYICHMWDYHTPIEEIMQGLHEVIMAGKVRYIGISNCYAWQLVEANMIARSHGWEEFISVQNHYNLLFREEEREMKAYCQKENIAMTPYSALASGRLSRHLRKTTKRMKEDSYAKGKYDATMEIDQQIIDRVEHLSREKKVSMTEISLAWLMNKVTAPVVGATKKHHIDGAVQACDLALSKNDMIYLEELYQPHALVGVMAENH